MTSYRVEVTPKDRRSSRSWWDDVVLPKRNAVFELRKQASRAGLRVLRFRRVDADGTKTDLWCAGEPVPFDKDS